MQKLQIFLVSLIVFSLSGCEAIAGIFKAGMVVGIFITVAVIALVIFAIAKMAGGGK